MNYFYVVIEGPSCKGAKFVRSEQHVLSNPLLAQVIADFARRQSMLSGVIAKPELLFVSFFHQLDDATAATIWPADFAPQAA